MSVGTETWSIKRLLEWTTSFFTRKAIDSPRLSAELLLAHVLACPRIKLYTDYERIPADDQLARFREFVRRAAEHEPIAYLTGVAHFFGLELEICSGVLIPRPDTETLVEQVIHLVRNTPGFETPRVLDLCTGSGCIALALAARVKSAQIVATDISDTCVDLARRNAAKLKLSDRVTVHQGDLFEALRDPVDAAPFHLILSNPPYISSGQIAGLDRNVREYEPAGALDGGADGLDFHRRILAAAADRLLPEGRCFLEIAFDQGQAARDLAAKYSAFDDARVFKDSAGNDRVLTARKKG